MKAICYVSRFANDITNGGITNLIDYVSFNNRLNNITGVLIIRNKHFFQVIEGENHLIDELYEKIKIDTRHLDVIKLLEIDLKDRVFNDYNSGVFEVFERSNDTHKLNTYFSWIKNAEYLPADQLIQLTRKFIKESS